MYYAIEYIGVGGYTGRSFWLVSLRIFLETAKQSVPVPNLGTEMWSICIWPNLSKRKWGDYDIVIYNGVLGNF